MWDVGGQEKLRPLWRHYYRGANALIYIVDSTDKDRIEESADELHTILQDQDFPKNSILLVMANKQDLPNALSPQVHPTALSPSLSSLSCLVVGWMYVGWLCPLFSSEHSLQAFSFHPSSLSLSSLVLG